MDRSDSAGGQVSEGSVHGEASPPERQRGGGSNARRAEANKANQKRQRDPRTGRGADDGKRKRKRRHGGVATIRLLVSGRPTRYTHRPRRQNRSSAFRLAARFSSRVVFPSLRAAY